MGALARILKTIQAQLSGFSPTARLLLGSLMAVLVLTLAIVALLTGSSDMVRLNLSRTANEQVRVEVAAELEASDVPYETRGNEIYVPADRKLDVLGRLSDVGVLGTQDIDFQSLFQNESVFMGREARRQRYLVTMMQVVQSMVRAYDDVADAKVVISLPERGAGFGKARIPASASVGVTPVDGKVDGRLAQSIASLVAGAVAGLEESDVRVTDNRTGITFRGDPDAAIAGANVPLMQKRTAEEQIRNDIERLLSYIPGVIVGVNAQVRSEREEKLTQTIEEPRQGLLRESSTERERTNLRGGGEPGVRPNTGASIDTAQLTSSESENASDTASVPAFPHSTSRTVRPAGEILSLSASVLVPRSWLMAAWQAEQGDGEATPDPAALDAFATSRFESIRKQVRQLVDTGDGGVAAATQAENVTVDAYEDAMHLAAVGGSAGALFGTPGGGGGGVVSSLLASGLVSNVGLLVLGLASLGLMFMVVRNASREQEMPSAEELVGIPKALETDDSAVVGEAEEGEVPLEGAEVDEATVARLRKLEQINALGVESPNEAAALLRKWISQDDP